MNLDINDLVNLNDVPLLDTEELSPGTKNAPSSPFILTPDRKQMKKRANKRRSKLQIETKRDSLGLFQNLDSKEISMLDDWTPTIEPTPKKRASNKFIFVSPIKESEAQPENSNVDTQIEESIQLPKLQESQILPSAVIETAPFVLDEIRPEIIKTPEKTSVLNDELLYTTPPKQIQPESFAAEDNTEEKQPKTLKDLFNSIAEDDKRTSKLIGSAFKTPKSVSKMRSVIITPNLCLSSKKTPRIKLFSVTPKIPKEASEDSNTNEGSREHDMPRSPTFADLGLCNENLSNLSTPSKIQPPTPKLSTWTASPAMCLTRNGVELSSPSSAFKRRMRLPYKASPRREGMTPIPMSLSGEFSRSKIVLSLSVKKMSEISSENKDEEQIPLSTSSSSIPEPPSSPTKSTPRKPRDTDENSRETSSEAKNSALMLHFSQELKERAEQLSNESAESRDIPDDSAKTGESNSQLNDSKPQQHQQQTILNKFFADKRKNMNMKKQLVKAFEEEEMNFHKKDKEVAKQAEEAKKVTAVERPKAVEGTISTGIPLPKTSVPKLSSGLRPTNPTTVPSASKQSAPASATKKSTPTTPSKSVTSVNVSGTSATKATTSALQKKTVVSRPNPNISTSVPSKPVPAATPSVASKKTSVTASATKTKPAPFVAATPLSQRSVSRTPSTATKAPAQSATKAQTIKSVFSSATSAKENARQNAPPTVSKLETKKRKRDEDNEFSSSSAGMASFDQLLKQTTNPEPTTTVSGSRRTTLLSSSMRRESSYFYRKEQEQKKKDEEDSLSLFEKQLEAAMKSGSAKASFGSLISAETDSPARKKAKIDC